MDPNRHRDSVLPEGWDHRLVTYHASNELGEATALCVSVEDTCAAKLMRLWPYPQIVDR